MKALLALWFCLPPMAVQAEQSLDLAALIDSLSRADLKAGDLRDAIAAAGLVATTVSINGPDSLPAGSADPFCHDLHPAGWVSGGETQSVLVNCTRFGRIDTQSVARLPGFAPGAIAQLAGRVLYPPLPDLADDVAAQGQPARVDQALWTGCNEDPLTPRRASRIAVDFSAADRAQIFDLISHLAPQGF
ncbi:MAG: hypothetical protein WAT25_05895 [Paracoccaceae bacterium]